MVMLHGVPGHWPFNSSRNGTVLPSAKLPLRFPNCHCGGVPRLFQYCMSAVPPVVLTVTFRELVTLQPAALITMTLSAAVPFVPAAVQVMFVLAAPELIVPAP